MLSTQEDYTHLPGSGDILVSVQSHLQDRIVLESGIEIYLPSHTAPGKFASVEATVAGVGAWCPLDLKVGDTVAVDYGVFNNYIDIGNDRHYKNISQIGKRLVWRVTVKPNDKHNPFSQVFAIKREEGWKAIGGYCLLEEIIEPAPENEALTRLGLAAPETVSAKVVRGQGRFISGPEDVAYPGQTVLFNEGHRNIYLFPNGKEYIKIHQNLILAKVTEPASA